MPERLLVAEVPDWPVIAAGCPPEQAAVVVAANQVVAASPAARAEGVTPGLRRREAQRRCPEVVVVAADLGRDARAWEPAVAAAEAFTPGVEVMGPGRLALATRGPARYFGGDGALGTRLVVAVESAVGRRGCRVGVADGRFAATLAAAGRSVAGGDEDAVRVVPPGASEAFLRPWPVATLDRPPLADLLVRLGLRTLGDLAALPPATVLARFGPEGQEAWRLARGLDRAPLAVRTPPPDLVVAAELDPPAERVDTAAFVGKALADELHARLADHALACTRVAIAAETEHGEGLVRRWRHEGRLDAGAIADRVRWQLEGWLAAAPLPAARAATPPPAARPSGGISLLRLSAEEVHPDHGRQLGLWGGSAVADDRVARSLARLQGLLGPEAVVTAVLGGGRDPAAQVRLVPWGDPRGERPAGRRAPPPWPGRLPGPSPALVHRPPQPAEVCDADGQPVAVTGRGSVTGAPGGLAIAGGPRLAVTAWAGPWPVEERWWDDRGRRCARFQLVLATGETHLVVRERGRWWVEATYD